MFNCVSFVINLKTPFNHYTSTRFRFGGPLPKSFSWMCTKPSLLEGFMFHVPGLNPYMIVNDRLCCNPIQQITNLGQTETSTQENKEQAHKQNCSFILTLPLQFCLRTRLRKKGRTLWLVKALLNCGTDYLVKIWIWLPGSSDFLTYRKIVVVTHFESLLDRVFLTTYTVSKYFVMRRQTPYAHYQCKLTWLLWINPCTRSLKGSVI